MAAIRSFSFFFLLLFLFLLAPSSFPPCCAALSDGDSLLAVKEAWGLNLSSWQANSDPCNGWERIKCDADDRVTYLNLSNMGIVGPIPSEVGNLQHLTTLDLSNQRNSTMHNNRISGNLSVLGALVNLQVLNISFNKLYLSSFPPEIFNLTNLIYLQMDNNAISGALPKELSQLTMLEYLYLGNNSLTGPIPPEFGKLGNLKILSLWNNNLQSTIPPELGNLSNLTYLNLHDCNLYGGLPTELGNLKSLENISLYRNQLTGIIPESWKNLKNLTTFLVNNNYFTRTFPIWLYDLPNLYNISIAYNYLYGNLSNATNSQLVNFSVTCNFFSGPDLSFPTVKIFSDTGNCFTDSIADEKIKCFQSYFDCDSFTSLVTSGGCPVCPSLQGLINSTTCECSRDVTIGETKSHSRQSIIIGSVVGVGVLMTLIAIVWWKWSRSRKVPHKDFWEGPEGVHHFSFHDLSVATDGFDSSHEIGSGGFGKVFVGVVDGKKVAIKRAHSSAIQSSSGFRNEVMLLSRLHHRHLVHLLGFCEEEGIQILVYEYMSNGNLQTLLFKNTSTIELDWLRRLDIAIGVAQGLEYLHSFANPPVIHRDVKPSNILLDDNLVAKLADFGISKAVAESETQFATRPAGTVGYIDPQYILREQLTTASDVYSFGIVLLELITGQKAIDNTRLDDHNLVEAIKLRLKSGVIDDIVDVRLGDEYPRQLYFDMVRLALDCASFDSESRPSMKVVAAILDTCRWSVTPQVLETTEAATTNLLPSPHHYHDDPQKSP